MGQAGPWRPNLPKGPLMKESFLDHRESNYDLGNLTELRALEDLGMHPFCRSFFWLSCLLRLKTPKAMNSPC